MRLLISVIAIASLFTALSFVAPDLAIAQQEQQNIVDQIDGGNNFGLPENEASDANLRNILQTVFLIAGAISVVFTVIGGLRYVLSEGNDQKIKQAKDTITYAIVGLIVSLSAYSIVSFVIRGIS